MQAVLGTLFILKGTLNRRKQRALLQFIDLLHEFLQVPKTKPGNTEMSFHSSQSQKYRRDFNNMVFYCLGIKGGVSSASLRYPMKMHVNNLCCVIIDPTVLTCWVYTVVIGIWGYVLGLLCSRPFRPPRLTGATEAPVWPPTEEIGFMGMH